MKDENINDPLREKLNKLSEVPEGLHFNHSAVWQKLEQQLQKKNNKRNRFVFVYAAASLLLFVIVLIYHSTSKPAKTASTAELIKTTNDGKSGITPERNKNILPVPSNETTFNPTKQKQLQLKIQKPFIDSIQAGQKTNAVEFTTMSKGDSNENTLPILVEMVTAPEVSVLKPRFKIAHINEINRSPVQVDVAHAEKNNYGFTLRKEPSSSSLVAELQSLNYPVNKQKTLFNLITSQ